MGWDVLAIVLGAVASLLGGGVLCSNYIQKFITRVLNHPRKVTESYATKLSSLTKQLDASSKQIDRVLFEIATVAENRQQTVEKLETELKVLEDQEQHMKFRIEALENTPLEAAAHFAALIADGEKRSKKRDYVLFGAGVLASTLVSLISLIIEYFS
ncbi:hypothetical protein [Breoghania sp. L-A4]|uniref:hypothetical protein n=1 Tax=Breoghania sp. L-A4 TaxID=2304600 RepID=UPI000E358254|nr:hypothetical protein [Breoghania sp. L-A4]AXS41075.1 hypothetical protein D1F64_14885 [Breoghania sp. L-A4]